MIRSSNQHLKVNLKLFWNLSCVYNMLTLKCICRRIVNSNRSVRLYHENIIDHYENPRNVGSMDKKSSNVGTGLVGAPACGDVMKVQLEVVDGIVVDAKFKTFGCGSAIASSSVATEWVKGRTVNDCLTIKVNFIKIVFY